MTPEEQEQLQELREHIQDDISQNKELQSEIREAVQSLDDAEDALSQIIRDFPGKVVARSWIRSKQSMIHEAMEDLSHYIGTLDALNRINDGTMSRINSQAESEENSDATEQKGN